jgi:opacity protein-like surface antigen
LNLFPLTGNAEQIDDPCAGPSELLAIIDRPTGSDSPCVVKPGKVLVEAGYQYQRLFTVDGYQNQLPQAEFRLGLPYNNEINLLAPNYVNQHISNQGNFSGSTAAVFGLKHELGYTSKWIYTIEALFTVPSGSSSYGSDGWGYALNGIINYSITSAISITAMIGVTSETDPTASGGGRFNSFNPDVTLTWQLTPKFQIYGEVYGQTKTSAVNSSGYNTDMGMQYLITPNIEVDAEYGVRLSGNLIGFQHYFGAGGGIQF